MKKNTSWFVGCNVMMEKRVQVKKQQQEMLNEKIAKQERSRFVNVLQKRIVAMSMFLN
ncbi:MAG: hypothetical protein K2N87_13785 [Eubacterium sp.]|nr:hypothetical protein [Eubacterium sp.]